LSDWAFGTNALVSDHFAGKDAHMNDQSTLFTRIGSWFKRGGAEPRINGDLVDSHEHGQTIEPRSRFLRPWARRDAAISNLQEGFHTLTDLMSTIRDNLDRQNNRQDELINYLSRLPQVLESLPESSRVQGEALHAIRQQLAQQNGQQQKLSEILEKIGEGGTEQRVMIDSLRQRVESLRDTDEAIAENLSSVGSAMKSVSHTSATSAQVLEQMRDRVDQRDGQLEQILQRQNTRFTTMLAIAIFLSVAALVAVSIVGYLLLNPR
jgi:DNA repair ATPase RecN